MVEEDPLPRDWFRVLTRQRSGYDGVMYDVQLQIVGTGALVWAQSFSDENQAQTFHDELENDLEALDMAPFRSKYGVPAIV